MDNRIKILIGFAVLLAAVVIVVAVGGGGDDEEDSGSAGSDVEIEVLEEGTGPEAAEGDTLQIRYTGTLLADGTEFDSNADGGAPALPVTLGADPGTPGSVIPGFDQGLEGAKAGEKRKITIPSDLGYGAQGNPPAIPPDADLVFEIEVESIGAAGGGAAPPQ